ncbi:MAG: lysophospholipid acyltransferase family protein [Pseudomonadota bacterium]
MGAYIRLVQRTSRFKIIGLEHVRALEAETPRGFFVAFWHSNILLAPSVRDHLRRRLRMLVSTHRDGEIIVNAVAGFDIDFIRGSAANERKSAKDKQGASAIAQMIGAIDAGDAVGLTPDGPRGPARSVQAGVVRLASMTGAPVIGFACVASRRRTLKTWDRFQLALPFSTVYVVVSPPVAIGAIDAHADVADAKARIKAALDAAAAEATRRADGVGDAAEPQPLEAAAS